MKTNFYEPNMNLPTQINPNKQTHRQTNKHKSQKIIYSKLSSLLPSFAPSRLSDAKTFTKTKKILRKIKINDLDEFTLTLKLDRSSRVMFLIHDQHIHRLSDWMQSTKSMRWIENARTHMNFSTLFLMGLNSLLNSRRASKTRSRS